MKFIVKFEKKLNGEIELMKIEEEKKMWKKKGRGIIKMSGEGEEVICKLNEFEKKIGIVEDKMDEKIILKLVKDKEDCW